MTAADCGRLGGQPAGGAGGVVERPRLEVVTREEPSALAERLRMRVGALQLAVVRARRHQQAVPDRHAHLCDDAEIGLDEQVVDLADRALDGVLDGHETHVHGSGGHRVEDVAELAAGHRHERRVVRANGEFSPRAALTLERGQEEVALLPALATPR